MGPCIPGLRYVPDYLAAALHDQLLAAVDASPWQRGGGRGAQIYGFNYDVTTGVCPIGELPPWALETAARLQRDELTAALPNQVIANEYPPGSGIFPHVDLAVLGDTIVSISLGSTCAMQFVEQRSGRVEELFVEPRSALVLSGGARHDWKHGITPRPVDTWMGRRVDRGRRVSLTFRTVPAT